MKTRFTLDPVSGEFKDRNGNSLGIITTVTVDLAPNALNELRFESELREALWERAGFQCERCGKPPWATWLQMHHRTYERLGAEGLDDVELLCIDCHRAEHARLADAGTPLQRPKRATGIVGGSSSGVPTTSTTSGKAVDKGGVVGEPKRPTASQLEREAVERIWAYWLKVSGKGQRLDPKRERIIRNALTTVRTADGCELDAAETRIKQALLGLSLSPWHRGENEARRTYMEVRYALKGRGDESDDERIEKAIGWSVVYASNRPQGLDPDTALRYLEEVRYFVSKQAINPAATTGRSRAVEAYGKLRNSGYTVVKLDKPPWARFEA